MTISSTVRRPLAAVLASMVVVAPVASEVVTDTAAIAGEDSFAELPADDECAAGDESCALNALQLKAHSTQQSASLAAEDANHSHHIWHYAQNCWYPCRGYGFCENWCGPGNSCCKYGSSADPPECHTVRFWPITTFYTCVSSGYRPHKHEESSTPGVPESTRLIYADHPALLKPSDAPVLTYYMYRVQSDENYAPENQDMGNLAGIMWYLHNEIVVHPRLQRSGTFFSTPKTRIERFKVSSKATQPVWDLGMNFGVVNAFDSTKCTGPYDCKNFETYGYAVGCENWEGGAASFPHGQWVKDNKYPGATWYALPGPCSSHGIGEKSEACVIAQPGGACKGGTGPTGAGDCTYVWEKVGELSIDELEGVGHPGWFKAMNYQEYNPGTDRGYGMSFWNNKGSEEANKARVDKAAELFAKKYPDQPQLADPICDFNRWKFYGK